SERERKGEGEREGGYRDRDSRERDRESRDSRDRDRDRDSKRDRCDSHISLTSRDSGFTSASGEGEEYEGREGEEGKGASPFASLRDSARPVKAQSQAQAQAQRQSLRWSSSYRGEREGREEKEGRGGSAGSELDGNDSQNPYSHTSGVEGAEGGVQWLPSDLRSLRAEVIDTVRTVRQLRHSRQEVGPGLHMLLLLQRLVGEEMGCAGAGGALPALNPAPTAPTPAELQREAVALRRWDSALPLALLSLNLSKAYLLLQQPAAFHSHCANAGVGHFITAGVVRCVGGVGGGAAGGGGGVGAGLSVPVRVEGPAHAIIDTVPPHTPDEWGSDTRGSGSGPGSGGYGYGAGSGSGKRGSMSGTGSGGEFGAHRQAEFAAAEDWPYQVAALYSPEDASRNAESWALSLGAVALPLTQ
ncbi:hypothetical protein B484DRAFT_392323, partial [Ochromonadaceae sp. CCMP2298]